MTEIYICSQHTTRAGRLALADADTESPDVFLWGSGTDDELIGQARARLAERRDTRPGGAGDDFDWVCAQNVLAALHAEEETEEEDTEDA